MKTLLGACVFWVLCAVFALGLKLSLMPDFQITLESVSGLWLILVIGIILRYTLKE